MTPLASLQGNGGGRIPMEGFSYDVSRQELTRIIEAMPTDWSRHRDHRRRRPKRPRDGSEAHGPTAIPAI